MSDEDGFEPRPGRIRHQGSAPAEKFLRKVDRAAARYRTKLRSARARAAYPGRGRLKAVSRHPFKNLRMRRVAVKIHFVKLAGAMNRARAHLAYLERDGAERSGEKGRLYGSGGAGVEREAFLDRSKDDRHQFRIIVSPEDGCALADMTSFTSDLMTDAERDLGTKLDWAAVNHFDTAHPHAHVILRGRADDGKDLVIARNYIAHGFRRRAEELATIELGPRRDADIARAMRDEIERERFTGLDRKLLERARGDALELARATSPYERFERTVLAGRLRTLERMGLASRTNGAWRLRSDMEAALRALGKRGDIVKAMHRALGDEASARQLAMFADASSGESRVAGEVLAAGFADEQKGTRYLVIDGVDGRCWHIEIGMLEPGAEPAPGAIAVLERPRAKARKADRIIDAVARRNGGFYSDGAHRAFDPRASAEFRLAHKRRLEAMRRAGLVERLSDSRFVIPGEFLALAQDYEARRQAPRLQVLSWRALNDLVEARGRNFLDDKLERGAVLPQKAGFGSELDAALTARRRFLLREGLAQEQGETLQLDATALERGARDERRAAGEALEKSLGKSYRHAREGDVIEGRYRKPVDLASGRYALIEKSKEFTLVPWRETLERRRGLDVSGAWRGRSISWSFGRERSGPEIA